MAVIACHDKLTAGERREEERREGEGEQRQSHQMVRSRSGELCPDIGGECRDQLKSVLDRK